MRALNRFRLALLTSVLLAFIGCQGAAIRANQDQLAQQETELAQLKQQIQALQNQNAAQSFAAPVPARGCDHDLMLEASRKGGERFAAGDFAQALPYYKDAITACPQSAHAHLNLARTYEALGDKTDARAQYQLAAAATTDNDQATAGQVSDALARLKP